MDTTQNRLSHVRRVQSAYPVIRKTPNFSSDSSVRKRQSSGRVKSAAWSKYYGLENVLRNPQGEAQNTKSRSIRTRSTISCGIPCAWDVVEMLHRIIDESIKRRSAVEFVFIVLYW